MKLAVIAAGEGSRLRAEGISVPKPLVSINGQPLIGRVITAAVREGISSACCIINEHSPELNAYLTRHDFGVELQVLVRSTPSSMHSLFALAPLLGAEAFCLATADTVFREEEFAGFLSHVKGAQADGTLAVTGFIDDERPLCVRMDDARRIVSFSDAQQEGYSWATGGLYAFSPRIFELSGEALDSRIERLRNFLRLLLSRGYRLEGYPFTKIIDVDHAHDIAVAEEFLRGTATSAG